MGWLAYREETLYCKIKQIPASHNLTYRDGKIETEKYWDIMFSEKKDSDLIENISQFRSIFLDSIKIHMRSDVPVGTSLSGGIDSSSIASAICSIFPNLLIKTFSIYYTSRDGMDERPFINEVISKYSNIQPFMYEPTDRAILDIFYEYMAHQDFPLSGSSFLSQYFVMKLARENGIKVLLDGQGADEYLVGYLRSFYRMVGQNILSKRGYRIFKTHINRENYDLKTSLKRWIGCLISSVSTEQVMNILEYRYSQSFLPKSKGAPFKLENIGNSRLDDFLYHLIFYTELPGLLYHGDLNSMNFSIESRVPFLDHRLVEFMFSIPDYHKVKDGVSKYILREAMKDKLPDNIYLRVDKKGFLTPGEARWLRGPLIGYIDNIRSSRLDFLDKKKIKIIINDYIKGSSKNEKIVWRLAMFSEWMNN